MSDDPETGQDGRGPGDQAPGDAPASVGSGIAGYLAGLVLATGLTIISFAVSRSGIFWAPGVAIGLCVLAVAQMGIHLVFFLHLTTGPDNINNALAVAFGVLIVVLLCAGSLWIMANLNGNMLPMDAMTNLQMQR